MIMNIKPYFRRITPERGRKKRSLFWLFILTIIVLLLMRYLSQVQ